LHRVRRNRQYRPAYVLPSQAQKHVTHNEALQRLDAVVQLTVTGELAAAPPAPVDGECYLIAAQAAGPWSGKDGMLAFRHDGAWIYIVPRDGWRAFFVEDGRLRGLNSGQWRDLSLPADGSLAIIGVNATPHGTNRLAVSAQASLFNHEGHRPWSSDQRSTRRQSSIPLPFFSIRMVRVGGNGARRQR
jgi:hypothetical protein